MKNPIRLLLLASALASLINSSFGAVIQFADPNFEAQIRSKVERGWYYVPGYTGKDYQFKTEDFEYRSSLDFDSDGPQINSLADLQHFPNLTSLYIWDAFKISDFSPIWNLKDKLEYLAINCSRNADLSGVAEMSKLRSLDLDDNQLTSLSILGNYPDLMELLLVGNYLDLSDAGIKATLSNFSNLIQTNRANQGWWWGSVIELEPQLPKSFQNLTSEMARVQNANDPQSNLLKGIHALLHIVESTEANSLKEFAVAIGVDSSIRQFTLSDLPMLENYSHTLNRDFNSGKLAELFQDSIIPSLEQVDSHFAKIPSGSVITLTQDLTGTEEPVTVDYADVLVLRSIVKLMATFASMQSAYDWDLNAGFIDDLEDNPDPNVEVTVETLRTHNSDFGGIRNAGQLAKAKQFLESAIATYKLASPLLTEYSRMDKSIQNGTPAPDRLFVLPIHDLDDEQEFRDALDEFQKALNAPYELKDDDWNDPSLVFNTEDDDIIAESETIDLSRFFAGKVYLAKLLPESTGNKFTTDVVSDPTLGGLLPDWTQRRVSDEMQAEGLVPPKYEIIVAVEGGGTVTGAGTYSEGASATLSAVPNEGYKFSGWQGSFKESDILNSPLSFSVTESIQAKAIFDENPLWNDPRSYVFWRYESVGDGPVNETYNDKESLILKSLSDGSEEVLYSINSKDLTAELNLSSNDPWTNGLWIEESKVQVSPDGSKMIFGYALIASTGASMSENRYLVRIVSYDMSTRQVSVIREWKGSNLRATTNAEYVDFCIEALTVDWNAGLLYFTEEKSSSDMAYHEPSKVRLVTCNLDGSGLKAICEFDAKTTSGATISYSANIEQIHIGSSDETIRVMVTYGNRNMGYYSEEILSFKADGTQFSLPIENEGIGNDSATSSVSETFESFSMTSDGGKILFAKYEGRSFAAGEPGKVSLLSLTKEGYDKQGYWSYDGNQSGAWNPSAGRTNPEITTMSDEKTGKIILVLEDQSTMAGSSNNLKAPELVELNVATGAAVILVRGRQTLDGNGMHFILRDDLETGFLFSPSGASEPPDESAKDTDGDGLPDDVEIASGMDPNSSDKQVVDAVYNYFFEKDGSVGRNLVPATPHTYNWYYQPQWGWLWTNEKAFPYVYRSSAGGQASGWLYFSEKSANPIRFYYYSAKKWVTLGE